MNCRPICIALASLFFASTLFAQIPPNDTPKAEPPKRVEPTSADFTKFSKVYETDFSSADDWNFVDDGWKLKEIERGEVLSLQKKASNYKPTVRSPLHIALLKEKKFTDFRLDVQVYSTHKDYGHRDVCLFFGYKSPTEFYYVHLGKVTDDRCNQIFVVNKADRTKISTMTSMGTNWDTNWHDVRIERDTISGEIRVYFDDMNNPVMIANDKTFTEGQIGLGSFDDTADFDNLTLAGPTADEKEAAKKANEETE